MKAIHEETRAAILAHLDGHYVDLRLSDPADELTSINAAFLVERGAQPAFERAVEAADASFNGRLAFKLVSPLPAYSFIDLVITLDSGES